MSDWYSVPNKRSAGYRPGEREAIAAHIAAHGVTRLDRPADITNDATPFNARISAKAHAEWAYFAARFNACPTMETVEKLAEQRGCSMERMLNLLDKSGTDARAVVRAEKQARRAAA